MTERRSEERYAAEGFVELQPKAPARAAITASLVDVSSGGFRARHRDFSLGTGDKVSFQHAGGSGTAVVMWTRVFDGQVESGFYTNPAE